MITIKCDVKCKYEVYNRESENASLEMIKEKKIAEIKRQRKKVRRKKEIKY